MPYEVFWLKGNIIQMYSVNQLLVVTTLFINIQDHVILKLVHADYFCDRAFVNALAKSTLIVTTVRIPLTLQCFLAQILIEFV